MTEPHRSPEVSRYTQLLEAVGAAVITVDADHRIVEFNSEAERVFGYLKSEISGQSINVLLPEGSRSDHDGYIKTFAAEAVQRRLMRERADVQGRNKDGRFFDAEVSIAKIEIAGQPLYMAIVRDVSVRKKLERDLRESDRHLRQAQHLAGLGSWEQDMVTDKVTWSAQIYQMFDVDPDTQQPSSELFFSKLHPDDRVHLRERFNKALANRSTIMSTDVQVIRSDGTKRILHELAELIWSSDGQLLRQIGTLQDVTEQRETAARLLQSERLLNRAQELAHLGSWDHNEATGEINWSENFFKVLGLDSRLDTPSNELFLSVVPLEDQTTIRETYKRAISDRILSATYDTRIIRPDGVERVLRNTVEYFWSENGDLQRVSGTSQDITEQLVAETKQKAALAAAQSADKVKSEFLANMSHELRTPLNAIIGFAEILTTAKLSPSLSERDREYAQDIRDSGLHLLDIINDVLDFSRLEAGSADIRDETIDTRALAAWVVKILGDKAHAKNLRLTTDIQPQATQFRGDLRLIRQALLNIVGNAIKFTVSGEISLSVRRSDDGGLVLAVSDTGIGMRPEDIPAALTPFTQLENSLQRQYEGVGLGFPLAKRFVELHGGVLDVASELQKGTTVTIGVPAWRCSDQESERRLHSPMITIGPT